MRWVLWVGALVLGAAVVGCQMTGDREEEVPLNEVPAKVIQAALGAVPGIVLKEAERETEDGMVVYCLEGEANGQEYEIDVTADGKVVAVGMAGDDDDDHEGDDGDDDGDDGDDDDG